MSGVIAVQNKKGIELPVNALIILALAVIILLAIVTFFVGTFVPTSDTTEAQNRFRNECFKYTNRGCCVVGADPAFCAYSEELRQAAADIGVAEADINKVCCNK